MRPPLEQLSADRECDSYLDLKAGLPFMLSTQRYSLFLILIIFSILPRPARAIHLAPLAPCEDPVRYVPGHSATIIGIAGGSGAGKSTLARKIVKLLEDRSHSVCHVSEDWFYLPKAQLPVELKVKNPGPFQDLYNLDHPRAFDLPLIAERLAQLRRGEAAEMPVYIFEAGRSEKTRRLGPCDTIVYEGIHAFYDAKIRDLYDFKIFVELDDAVRLERRLIRDERERSTSREKTQLMYDEFVRPMYDEFVAPFRGVADQVVSGESINDAMAVELLDQLRDRLDHRAEQDLSVRSTFKNRLIGISGGTASGKTTLAHELSRILDTPERPACVISEDWYYIPRPSFPEDLVIQEPDFLNGQFNFDHPRAFEAPLIAKQLADLRRGRKIEAPIYNYETNLRGPGTQSVGPCQVIIYEGIHALYHDSVRDLFDLKIFVDLADDVRLQRRLDRDVRERGTPVEKNRMVYQFLVRPMYDQYVHPMLKHADIIVPGESVADFAQSIAEALETGEREKDGTDSAGNNRLISNPEFDRLSDAP